ncbi:peptidylprolyl isomerase [Leptolyngbya iicbica]|uniref:peptidylprolyl isomerase n=2 Tax=Cyanophyceae TaxID=3028117 RepID=A0A4Q7E8Q9_9CYAN|nr:peptidylprolyl isomerase [Leptolyngbya sp. LK]RZM78901.1 peptidylprolyl isomerase [Leptolyngbya sp. LK]
MDLLKVGDRVLQSEELVPLLSKTNLLSRVIQEVIIDDAIADVELTEDEIQAAEAEFCQRNQISNPEEANAWAKQQYGTSDLIRTTAIRDRQLAKFKQQQFGKDLESYFLQRKSRLDRVLYSLIRTSQLGLAQELYYRIHDDGQPFADLAKEYSEGQESKTGGLIGPVELSVPNPALAGLLSVSKPGQIWPPKRIGEWYVVIRLEKFFPAQLDEQTEQRLLEELFQNWMREQLQQSPVTIPTADTLTVPAQDVPPELAASIPLNRDEITPATSPKADISVAPDASAAANSPDDPWQ